MAKTEHYVPQFYLRYFSINDKNQLFCFDKFNEESFFTGTKNIGAQNFFYDITDEQEVEDIFAELEGHYSTACKKIVENEGISTLEADDLYLISHFIATQDLRTSKFRKKVQDASDWFAHNEDMDRIDNRARQFINKTAEEEGAKRLQLLITGSVSTDLAEILMTEYKWILFVNHTDVPFWASDNPFTRYNFLQPRKYGDLGLGGDGAQGHLPLGPKLSLAIVDPEIYWRYPDVVQIENEEDVVRRNRLQVEQSERQIYSCEENFDLAKTLLSENPELADPHRNHYEDNYKGG